MSKQKGLFRYTLADGRIALSPIRLDYARDESGMLDLAAVMGDDAKYINLIADPELGLLLSLSYQGTWESPEKVIELEKKDRLEIDYHQNCALLAQGKVYVRDGRFIPLQQFLKRATKQDMICMLTDIAMQAALAQLELTKKADTGESV